MKFRLVDKIVAWSPYQRISGIKAVSFEEYCLKEAFGDEPRLPETFAAGKFFATGQLAHPAVVGFQGNRHGGADFRSALPRFSFAGPAMRMDVTLARQREDGFELSGRRAGGWPDNHHRSGLPGCARARSGVGGPGQLARAVLGDYEPEEAVTA